MAFADHFSDAASRYAAFRPSYDPTMIEWIVAHAPAKNLAWDCGTGNGQAANLLAEHFAKVIATDPSESQLSAARQHSRVTYALSDEHAPFIADASIDLVTAAQAIHWFDLDRFYPEVNRVLRPDGIIAVWSYGRPSVDSATDPAINWFHDERVGPMWPRERYEVESGYGSLPFPFREIQTDAWSIRQPMTRDAFLGYVGTWSAVRQARLKEGVDPMPEFVDRLASVWAGGDRIVSWPVSVRLGRVLRP
jgi:SAM-dependent methyltransferase